jgi:hypothetical protein
MAKLDALTSEVVCAFLVVECRDFEVIFILVLEHAIWVRAVVAVTTWWSQLDLVELDETRA